MGPLQRTPGTAPTAFSQDPPWLRRRERIALVKNRMREICTSGSARDGDGNVPIYSAFDLAQCGEEGLEGCRLGEGGLVGEELQPPGLVGGVQPFEEQATEEPGEDRDGRRKPSRQAIQRSPSGETPPPGTMMWACGWWMSVDPQVWSTAVNPMRAPRCLGSAAMVIKVSAAVLSNRT